MQKNTLKPVLVPTVYSARTLLWTLALVALFGVALWNYYAFGKLGKARAALAEPVHETVAMPLYTVRLPLGWETYAKDGDALAVFRHKDKDIPVLFCFAEQASRFYFHALDTNPTISFHIVEEDIGAAKIDGVPSPLPMRIAGTEVLTVRPGVRAVHMLFDILSYNAEAMIFYSGDVRYVLWAIWPDDDAESGEDCHRFFRRLFEDFTIPEMREFIDRPVVDSGDFTAETNESTMRLVGREFAQWRLFSARVEAEPESALLPALVHYRESLRLLSSIRQEHVALATEDYKLFRKFLERRHRDVAEWFVVLDKAVAMGDWDKARSQAKWIITHATLNGERQDLRRAEDILATKIPKEEDAD